MKIKLVVLVCSILFTSIYLYANQTTRLDEITIKRELNSSSYKTKSQSATKTDTPIFQTAQSVQVLTNEVLKNVAAVKMDNMLDYVSVELIDKIILVELGILIRLEVLQMIMVLVY